MAIAIWSASPPAMVVSCAQVYCLLNWSKGSFTLLLATKKKNKSDTKHRPNFAIYKKLFCTDIHCFLPSLSPKTKVRYLEGNVHLHLY